MTKNYILIGLLVAFVAGAMIAVQTTYNSRSGVSIGATRTGMMTAVTSAAFGLIVLFVMWRRGGLDWQWSAETWRALIIAGVLGAIILAAISFASTRAGITATLATLLLGQMAVASFADARALGGLSDPIPFTWPRLLGILCLIAGVYLVSSQK